MTLAKYYYYSLETKMSDRRPIRDRNAWLSMSSGSRMKHAGLRWMKILLLSDTYWTHIGNPLEIHRSLICLIRDLNTFHRKPIGDWNAPSGTDMPDRKPIGDWHSWSEIDIPDQRLTNIPNRRPSCLIRVIPL